jgi:hypothetical protein
MVELKTDAVAVAQVVVTETKAQAKAARRALADLLEARKPLAMAAPSDAEASAALAANRNDIIDAELAVSDTSTRLDAARAALADAERKQADDEAEKRLAEARQLADALIEQSKLFDQAATAGAAALAARDRLGERLRATGCLSAAGCEGLNSRSRIRAAFGHAGLHHFLNEFIALRHSMALAESDKSTLTLTRLSAESEAA